MNIAASDDIVLVVNNLGSLFVLELSIITTNTTRRLGIIWKDSQYLRAV